MLNYPINEQMGAIQAEERYRDRAVHNDQEEGCKDLANLSNFAD